MIVDHVNTYTSGGAAIAARRLHHALLEAGVDSRFWSSDRPHEADRTYRRIQWPRADASTPRQFLEFLSAPIARIQWKLAMNRELRGRPLGLEWFNPAWVGSATPYDRNTFTGDILHLHWIARLIDYPSFFAKVPDTLPIVWTLHDLHALTGGCHYAGDCERFVTECQNCPQLGRPGPADLSNRSFQAKRLALAHKNLHVVTPSRWLQSQARRSRMFAGAKSFHTIAYGVDVDVFAPGDKIAAKRQFQLPHDHVVIGFGADWLSTRRKGIDKLLAALGQLATTAPVVGLVFGRGPLPVTAHGLPRLHHTGFISKPGQLAVAYRASDLFVIASLEDNLPQTGLEAMACGTPVVGFDTGGIPDFVRPPLTGLLAKTGDIAKLAEHISWLVDRPQARASMGRHGRSVMLEEFHPQRQAREYVSLYESLRHQQWQLRASPVAA
jgi:glycosyltransferase involved in cell wall biosynthesis